ncbi:MAG: acyl-CoA thioesterase [Bacteroidales bacterium]|jgi:acyl-CoA thioester hydrolase|nr:acyl-CoA thioesterase [Bacteroidales bacterium]
MTTILRAEDIANFTFNHARAIQIRYNDIDVMGHVNNAVYHEYFNFGRVHYFFDMLGSEAFAQTEVVVAQTNTTYMREVLIEDDIQIVSKIIRFGTKSMDMLQVLVSQSEEGFVLHTFNVTTFVCVNTNTRVSEPIPEEWKRTIEKFEKQA